MNEQRPKKPKREQVRVACNWCKRGKNKVSKKHPDLLGEPSVSAWHSSNVELTVLIYSATVPDRNATSA